MSTKQTIFVDSSVSDTICTCIVLGNHRAALKVKQDFKVSGSLLLTFLWSTGGISFKFDGHRFPLLQVSEKRWYWLKASALATSGDWDSLEKFSREKRPPAGGIFFSFLFFSKFLNDFLYQ